MQSFSAYLFYVSFTFCLSLFEIQSTVSVGVVFFLTNDIIYIINLRSDFMLEKGIRNTITIKVTQDKTARVMGSGTLDVFATPAMVALMEQTAAQSVQPHLDEDVTSVGTKINVEHLSADPIDIEVTCESVLTEVDNRKLCFDIIVSDKHGVVGKAYHERFLIKSESFMNKTNAKL